MIVGSTFTALRRPWSRCQLGNGAARDASQQRIDDIVMIIIYAQQLLFYRSSCDGYFSESLMDFVFFYYGWALCSAQRPVVLQLWGGDMSLFFSFPFFYTVTLFYTLTAVREYSVIQCRALSRSTVRQICRIRRLVQYSTADLLYPRISTVQYGAYCTVF